MLQRSPAGRYFRLGRCFARKYRHQVWRFNVKDIHDTHVWSLDSSYHILTTHIVVLPSTTPEEILALKCLIREKISEFEVQHWRNMRAFLLIDEIARSYYTQTYESKTH